MLHAATVRVAWLQLMGCVFGLALLAAGLPDPRSLFGVLTGSTNLVTDDALLASTAQTAILAAAGLVVWVLLIWSVLVCATAAAGRLPGAPGLIGRSLLRRIAPAAAGRLVAAAVGVSLLAGTSACAAPALADLGSGSSTEAVSSQASSTASVPVGGGSGVVDPAISAGSTIASTTPATPTSTAEVVASIVIDWPDSAGPTVSLETESPVPSSTPPSTPAPNTTPTSTSAPAGTSSVGPASATPISATPTSATPTSATPTSATPDGGATPSGAPPAGSDSQPLSTSGTAGADVPPHGDPSATAPPQPSGDSPESVIVRGGDSLWSIAAQHLPPDHNDADIDTAWRAWYVANEDVIGDDPDLIQPGQQLLPPTTK